MGDETPRQAQVLIDSEMASWAMAQLRPNDVVEHRDDGSIVVTLDVRNTEMFRDWVLSFLDNALVLEPTELVDEIVGWLEAIS